MESARSPLWVGVAVSAGGFRILCAARAKAVTSRTPSPHSKTWRQKDRLTKSGLGLVTVKGRQLRCPMRVPYP
jgi:hypothetical protein